ncbi:MAG: tRNA (adenosine(37)-N6)-threonylcarbamoyltransferase complex ATPase subunit type 1 TsaE [Rhodobacterales bacterium]|nr:tRNA (adenosine(37)-N6)-threonylcarbamoyltransferase complex ATPase subunit type 1 TsaE [Rhodobacterales bacterium]
MLKTVQLTLTSPEETRKFAHTIAPRLAPGDVVLLQGDIGAGKTHFARCLIQFLLEEPEDIPSPTFTLVQTYPTRLGDLWHADLYRLSHPDEVIELGLTDAFSDAICLVEWPDRLGSLIPDSALTIQFSLPDTLSDTLDTRIITMSWGAPRWDNVLEGFTNV